MNQIYKKSEYIVIPVGSNFIIINIEKKFKDGHTHIKTIGIARMLIDLAIKKKLPKNPYYIKNLIRISSDINYINKLKNSENDNCNFEELMKHDGYKRVHGAIRQVKY